ncbi:hypothetical protein [Polynucleobacter sp. MWH-Jannik1A5]|uniref:hypothetical protein n=1 Tax=Polynucleobacter sp. MWH-Jannik1A5 TaxID=1855890 RepID=UPI001C0CC449|nr:hypothetical protein [Polynucleobacter sp. MWH-Jannik1A5]MBU3546741.1 hypothetical protein [Polynucleobacter sp. MWH-Jannik1A5]
MTFLQSPMMRRCNLEILIVFLLLSPGLSLIAFITGFYLPNNHIVYLAAFIRAITAEKVDRIIFLRSLYFFIGITAIFLLRSSLGVYPTISDINFIVTYAALPFVTLFFINSKSFVNAFLAYAVIASAWSWVQQILMNFGAEGVLLSLLTYPTQVAGYVFDIWAPYLYRVPGFQLESSQFAFMLCLALALTYMTEERRDWKKICFFTATILANGSTTGFGGLIIVYAYAKKISIKSFGILIALLIMCLAIYSWTNLIDVQLAKVYDAVKILSGDFSNFESDRILGFFRVFENSSFEEIIFGRGLAFYGGYDFFSVSVIGLGMIGIFIWASYFFSFFTRESLLLIYLLSFYLISNGSLLDPNYHIVLMYIILRYRDFIKYAVVIKDPGKP